MTPDLSHYLPSLTGLKAQGSNKEPASHESSHHTSSGDESKKKAGIHKHEITKCTHSGQEYYANGMCKNCYHAKGRTKKATKCPHSDRPLYAKGICKNCYLSTYHKDKRQEKRKARMAFKESISHQQPQPNGDKKKRGRPCRDAIKAVRGSQAESLSTH